MTTPKNPEMKTAEEIAEGCIEHEVDIALIQKHSLGGTLKQMMINNIVKAIQSERNEADKLRGAILEALDSWEKYSEFFPDEMLKVLHPEGRKP